MAERYYVPTAPPAGRAMLTGAEAHHLLHVMRASVGDEVTLFDGTGGEYPARVATCRRSEVELDVGERLQVDRELSLQIVLGVALPKGDRQRWLVEKLTELGVAKLVPLVTERSVVVAKGKSLERLERTVIEASKQCGRNRLMQIARPMPLAEFLTSAPGTRLIAHPTGMAASTACGHELREASVIVGPEGGLTDGEVADAVEQGWQPVSLGRSILRIETAAVAMAALLANAAPPEVSGR